MTLRGPIDAAVPTLLTPIGEVEIEGKKYPVRLDGNYRRLLEALFQRTGSFDDEVFDIDAVSSDLGSRIEDAVNRLEALEAGGQEVSDILSALEELRQRIDVIESLPSVAEPVDAERLVADAIAAASNVIEEAEFNRPGIGALGSEDEITNALVAAAAEIRLSKLYYPQKTQASSESPNWNSGAGVIRLTRGSTNTSHVIFEKMFTDVSATNLVFFNGSVLVTPSEQTPGTVDDATTTSVTSGRWILKEDSSSGTGGTVLAQGNINYSTQPGGWQSANTATDSFQEALNKVYTLSNTGTVYVKLIYQFTSGSLADIADFGSNTAFQVTGALGIDD